MCLSNLPQKLLINESAREVDNVTVGHVEELAKFCVWSQ